MKITKSQLKQIIKEELATVLNEITGIGALPPVEPGPGRDVTRHGSGRVSHALKAAGGFGPEDVETKAQELRTNLESAPGVGEVWRQLLENDPEFEEVFMDVIRRAAKKMLFIGEDEYTSVDFDREMKQGAARQLGRKIGSYLPGGAKSTVDE